MHIGQNNVFCPVVMLTNCIIMVDIGIWICRGICEVRANGWGKVTMRTTPPSKIKDFAHLPLHRGGFPRDAQ